MFGIGALRAIPIFCVGTQPGGSWLEERIWAKGCAHSSVTLIARALHSTRAKLTKI